MNNKDRSQLNTAAKEVLLAIDCGYYNTGEQNVSIADSVAKSTSNSRLYSPFELESLLKKERTGISPDVEVIDATTQQAAQAYSAKSEIALLNFASARNPGGGFLGGAKAQEEDLCRCSTLYATLLPHTAYYETNRNQSSLLYTDYAIFSPNVLFFKVSGRSKFLESPFYSSVITAPAPNSRPYLERKGDKKSLEECFERRWENVIEIAIDNSVSVLLLGAWGCGAFGGDPQMAARTAKNAINRRAKGLQRVVFAIPNKGMQSATNFQVFSEYFG